LEFISLSNSAKSGAVVANLRLVFRWPRIRDLNGRFEIRSAQSES